MFNKKIFYKMFNKKIFYKMFNKKIFYKMFNEKIFYKMFNKKIFYKMFNEKIFYKMFTRCSIKRYKTRFNKFFFFFKPPLKTIFLPNVKFKSQATIEFSVKGSNPYFELKISENNIK